MIRVLVLCLVLSGCATTGIEEQAPVEELNKDMVGFWKFEDGDILHCIVFPDGLMCSTFPKHLYKDIEKGTTYDY